MSGSRIETSTIAVQLLPLKSDEKSARTDEGQFAGEVAQVQSKASLRAPRHAAERILSRYGISIALFLRW